MASKVTRVYVQESYGPDVQIPVAHRDALLSGVSSSGRGCLLRPWNRCVGDELAFAGRQSSRPVATLTLLGCRLVKEDLPIPDDSNLFVASNTADVLVQTLQGKRSPLVVVEKRRLPLRTVVTIHASSHAILLKLLAMNVLVAVLALDGRSREVSGDELGFQVGRLVAVDAGRRSARVPSTIWWSGKPRNRRPFRRCAAAACVSQTVLCAGLGGRSCRKDSSSDKRRPAWAHLPYAPALGHCGNLRRERRRVRRLEQNASLGGGPA